MAAPAPRQRILELDALRGFAICGIMLVNTWQHTIERHRSTPIDWVMGNLFQGRFYPIFAFLFGVSCTLFLGSAVGRTPYPRLVLLRRLAVLALFGVIHRLVNPGEVLLPYAILGVVVLLPVSFLPASAVLFLGIGITVAALATGDPWVLIAGLLPLGMATARYGTATLPTVRAPPVAGLPVPMPPVTGLSVSWLPVTALLIPMFPLTALLGMSTGLATALTWWWNNSPPTGGVYQAAGLCGAVAYACGFLLLARASRWIGDVFEPLGRMALTNYLTSTAVILAARPMLVADGTRIAVIALSLVTLAAQVAASRWWLARHRYGPLEWAWRSLTWWEPIENGQTVRRDPRSTVPDPDRSRSEDEPRNRA
jgi:uncharacterized membrane protein YeiB